MLEIKPGRRSFCLQGGAILGAGVTTIAASARIGDEARSLPAQLQELRQQLDRRRERDAIRQLYLTFTRLIEDQNYAAAAALFHEHGHLNLAGKVPPSALRATGKSAIAQLFTDQYGQQMAAALHTAYRQNASQQKDTVALSDDRLLARATFHAEVEVSTPLPADCTVAQMARLQGQMATRRWENGRFEAQFVKTEGRWEIVSLDYAPA
jgi:hypothetical protein